MAVPETQAIGRWIPLESNPLVLNSWSEKLGLSTEVTRFEDVYGLDKELLSLVPQPAKALLLIFPINERIEKARTVQDTEIKENGQHKLDPTIIFIQQTIPNACGTIGLLHALANSNVTIKPMSALAKFFEEIASLTPAARAALLEKTPLFESAHVDAASLGQTAIPADLNTDLHFVTFIQASSGEVDGQRRVVELDGRRPGPIDHGKSEDFLEDVANIVRTKFIALSSSQNFGLISLGPPA